MLSDQVISKILDFQNVPAQKDNEVPPDYLTSQEEGGSLKKQTARITRSKVTLIVTAWIILALTVCAVVGKVGFQLKFPLSLGAIERTNGFLLHTGILTLAACVLGLTTWLYSKNKIGGSAIVAVIIGTILSASLPLLTLRSGIATGDAKKPRATFSLPSSPTSSPTSAPTSAPVVAVTDTVVNGILYSEDNPSALIGHRIVHEGDVVGDVSVIKIHKDKIECAKNGRRWIQTVGETLYK